MKWVEIIELRTVDVDRALLSLEPQSLMAEVTQESKLRAIKVYSHGTVETDISIHLLYDSFGWESRVSPFPSETPTFPPPKEKGDNSEQADIRGSPLGLRLASALKEFGLVNHNVWVEIHNFS